MAMLLSMWAKIVKAFKFGISGSVIQYRHVQSGGMVRNSPIMAIPSMLSIEQSLRSNFYDQNTCLKRQISETKYFVSN